MRASSFISGYPLAVLLFIAGCGSNSPLEPGISGGNAGSGAGGSWPSEGGKQSKGGTSQSTTGTTGGSGNTAGDNSAGNNTAGENAAGGTARGDLNDEQRAELGRIQSQLEENSTLSAEALLAKRKSNLKSALSYRPLESQFMEKIQGSALKLNDAELARLGENGFVISTRSAFPTFVRGYAAIYSEHLPIYVSADAILEAVHSSYDEVLRLFESNALIPNLNQLLGAIHDELAAKAADEPSAAAAGLDLYLSVARSLLSGQAVAPRAGAKAAQIKSVLDLAVSAQGESELELFGHSRKIDASQFTPRGHYNDNGELARYFRAMMWLGRMDFRLIETYPDGSQQFLRSQYEAMLLLRECMSASSLEKYSSMDSALRTFVGDSDNMTVPQVDDLVTALGGVGSAKTRSDADVQAALVAGGFGVQRIASQIMVNEGKVPTLPLSRSFALFGQRYVIDSHVFSQVVYDRTPSKRMMPNPLDAAYAALGNDQALPLLAPELGQFNGYPGALESARTLVDAHDATFWNSNLYTLWLSSLRALSPSTDLSEPAKLGLPEVVGTEAWGRRILNTQLGSWAELRHDTLLYAKQSYTGVPACDYPDAYVDPYPEFYERLRAFGEAGARLAQTFPATEELSQVLGYFQTLQSTMSLLGEMAQYQRAGTPFTEAQLAFINKAVRIVQQNQVCTTVDAPDGWLADLYLTRETAIEEVPTIADVHTQPADEAGNPVGKVLHVGTGWPRLMVTTVDTCQGPRAYVGVTFAYHEVETKDYERLTDQAWKQRLASAQPDPAWLDPVLAK